MAAPREGLPCKASKQKITSMRLRHFLFFALVALSCRLSAQEEQPALPVDEDVRIGVLDNGLTYFIRHNNWPENRANFYIAQKVGSLQEEDNQRGLAHFLEHMCFNGTDNFAGNDVVDYCRSIGVEYGRDLNAYTSVEETVYNIDNVPTFNESALDSCLLILRDWADGLLLEPDEIDKERGVIHEEWRMRTSAAGRMVERNLPAMYPGSKYGYRYPIGTMEVVDNFQPQELRDYYEKWYHPTNQGIIVVGNVDVDHIEAKIKELFSPMTNPEDVAPIVPVAVPDNDEAIIIIDKDPEYRTSDLDIFMKHEAFPDSLKNTMGYIVYRYVIDAATHMLGDRYDEAALAADCPYVSAGAGDGPYILSKAVDAFSIGLRPKEPALLAEALTAALVEARRAAEYGFTATEYARFKESFLSRIEKEYSNKDNTPNAHYYQQIKDYFLDNEPLLSMDDEYVLWNQLVPMIPLEAVNDVMHELVLPSDTNVVVVNYNNEAEGAYYPTREELLAALHAARQVALTPYVDNVKDEPLISALPTPGTIVSETTNAQFDYTELTLSNGVTVVLKQTDFKKDEVTLSGEGGAGQTAYAADDVNVKIFDDVIAFSGLGEFSTTELQKALAGKIANADLTMGERKMAISGSSTPKDVETMLQMVYLYFTAIKKDEASYANLMNQLEVQLKNRALNPDIAFSDSLALTLCGHNLREYPLLIDDLPQVSYDTVLAMASAATRSANGWEFTIIGNYDAQTIRPLICQYLGALPAEEVIASSPRAVYPVQGKVDNIFYRPQETPKAIACMVWTNDEMDYTYEKAMQMSMIGDILEMEYTRKIREDASAAYVCSARAIAHLADDGYHSFRLQAYCPMKPEKKEIAMEIMASEVPLATETIDEENLAKVKEIRIKNYDDNQNKNGYWNQVLTMWRHFGIDVQSGGREMIERQTPALLQATLREFLAAGNVLTVAMFPTEESATPTTEE